jgi:hypothetical protein
MDEQDRKRALNEIAFRELNEEVHQSNGENNGSEFTVVCECGSADCVRVVRMTRDEYEAVRAVPTWFIVASGHRQTNLERVAKRTELYTVVEKCGEAAVLAEQTDPRSGEDLVPGGSQP